MPTAAFQQLGYPSRNVRASNTSSDVGICRSSSSSCSLSNCSEYDSYSNCNINNNELTEVVSMLVVAVVKVVLEADVEVMNCVCLTIRI